MANFPITTMEEVDQAVERIETEPTEALNDDVPETDTTRVLTFNAQPFEPAIVALDRMRAEEAEAFVPEPLADDAIQKLDMELTQYEGEAPERLPGDFLYVPNRRYVFDERLENAKSVTQRAPHEYDEENEDDVVVDTPPETANLITSECENGMHAPVLDIDLPVEVYPSSQLGHNHLYIQHEMTWEQYTELLTTLARCGIIEEGYANASIARGFSAVRPVGVQKHDAPTGAHVLRDNAMLRLEIYELRKQLMYQTAKAEEQIDWGLVKERDQLAETAQTMYEENQRIQHEVNQLREELNRVRLQQANTAAISWT